MGNGKYGLTWRESAALVFDKLEENSAEVKDLKAQIGEVSTKVDEVKTSLEPIRLKVALWGAIVAMIVSALVTGFGKVAAEVVMAIIKNH